MYAASRVTEGGRRIAVAVLAVGAAGVPMGIPFPARPAWRGSRQATTASWPWARGINGMVSVVASLGSYLLAIVVGHAALFVVAAVLYVGAVVAARRLDPTKDAEDVPQVARAW